MSVTLAKGEAVSLSKPGEALHKVRVGLGWDESEGPVAFDLDASAFGLCNGQFGPKVFNESYFVFYNNPAAPNNAIVHMGDNLTGADQGEDDDETIVVDLSSIHPRIDTVAIAVTIHEAEARRQNFGMVNNAYIRVMNDQNGQELLRYNLTNEATFETAVVLGEIYRQGSVEWRFRATGKPYAGGLLALVEGFGIDVRD